MRRINLLDVESVETGGQTGELSLDVDGGSLVLLGEVDGSGDVLLVGAEDADSLDSHVVYVVGLWWKWERGRVCWLME